MHVESSESSRARQVNTNSPIFYQKNTAVASYSRVFRGGSIDPGPDQRRNGTSVSSLRAVSTRQSLGVSPDQDLDQSTVRGARAT